MLTLFLRVCIMLLLATSFSACAIHRKPPLQPVYHPTLPAERLALARGQKYFLDGYYKSAMRVLLPLACDGNPVAQYAVGYMYYYGYGVSQDTDVGCFWIKRAADKCYPPAMAALAMIDRSEVSVVTDPNLT